MRRSQSLGGRPPLPQAQPGGRPQAIPGDLQRGPKGAQQLHPQATLILGSALILAGDSPQLAMGDERLELGDREGPAPRPRCGPQDA
jgi:hypothetical protein